MSQTAEAADRARTEAFGRRYMIRFEEDTLRQRPLATRVIIEFLGTALLVTVAAGAGVINRYAGGNPISRTAAVVAPGALVMALICRPPRRERGHAVDRQSHVGSVPTCAGDSRTQRAVVARSQRVST
jgi:hypothetical protein